MTITIDGKPAVCQPGELLLDVAKRSGIRIPSLCHHDGLPGQGCCRVCIVEVEEGGRREVVASCVYPVERECAVFTSSDRVRRDREIVLALLRAGAPASSEVESLCREYGAPDTGRFAAQADDEKCILCGLCVKACESLGTGAISAVSRGIDKKVSTPYDEPSLACVGCGSCAAVCPTGAIQVLEDGSERAIWDKKLPLALCKRCGVAYGTVFEHYRASVSAETQPPELCPQCRRKSMTDTMAETYGR